MMRDPSIREAARFKSKKLALRSLGLSALALVFTLVLVFSLHVKLQSESIVRGIEDNLSQAVSVGDTFQITRQLSSLVEGRAFFQVWLVDSSSQQILSSRGPLQMSEAFLDREKNSSLNWIEAWPYWWVRYEIPPPSPGPSGSSLIALVSLPVVEFGSILLLLLIILGFISVAYHRQVLELSNALIAPIQRFSGTLVDLRRNPRRSLGPANFSYAEINLAFEEFSRLWKSQLEREALERELEQKRIVEQLSSQVSHDIQSPLLALKQVSREIRFPDEEVESLFKSTLVRIQEILHDLRRTSLDSLRKNSATSLLEVCRSIVKEKSFSCASSIEIVLTEIDADLPLVPIDQSKIKRVLSNLINNSIEALQDESGKIEIFLQQNDSFIKLSIKDSGKGIPSDQIGKLFERGASFGKEGHGLGLYYAKSVMEEIGGRIELSSVPGQFTRIDLYIPSKL